MCQLKKDGGRCNGSRTSESIRGLRTAGDVASADNLVEAREKYGNIVSHMELPVPKDVSKLLDTLETVGDPLLVGGTVRDALTPGLETPKDFDIEVHGASLDQVAYSLRSSGYHVDEVGKAFGVLKTRAGSEDIDISVPRRDSLSGVGHKGVAVEFDEGLTVTDASERRDFTINALMYSHRLGACIDPWGGKDDIKEGVLRHVSDAFGEDPLRPLRGFQFAGRYDLAMHPETVAVCQELSKRSDELPTERVRGEWDKFYGKTVNAERALTVLEDTGWDKVVGGLAEVDKPSVQRAFTLANEDGLRGSQKTVFIGGVMASFMEPKKGHQFLRRTIIDGDRTISQAGVLARTSPPEETSRAQMRVWARSLGKKGLSVADWERREKSVGRDASSVAQKAKDLGIHDTPPQDYLMGRHIIEAFPDRKPGPWVAKVISEAQQRQDAGEFADEGAALDFLRRYQF